VCAYVSECVCACLYTSAHVYTYVCDVGESKKHGLSFVFFGHTVVADEVQNNERALNANHYTTLFF